MGNQIGSLRIDPLLGNLLLLGGMAIEQVIADRLSQGVFEVSQSRVELDRGLGRGSNLWNDDLTDLRSGRLGRPTWIGAAGSLTGINHGVDWMA